MQSIDLSAHQTRHSVLLLFAPTAANRAFDEMSRQVWARPSIWRERRTIIYELFFEQAGMVFGRGVQPAAARDLATRLGVPDDRFTLVLVGVDGNVQLRSPEAMPVRNVVRTIDRAARHDADASAFSTPILRTI